MSPLDLRRLFSFLRPRRVGLALSGGVARGLAHIGVLKVLKKHKIPIHFVAGCSAGALAGAVFAAGMDPEKMEKKARSLNWLNYLRISLDRYGPATTDELQKLVRENIGDKKFEELKLPFAAVCADIKTGRRVILREGKVAWAVAASCAFPGVLTPIKHGADLLVDGGLAENLPVKTVKEMGANFIIAVDVVPSYPLKADPQNAAQMFGRSLDLVLHSLSAEQRKLADVLIEPEIPEDIWHLDIDKAAQLIKVGEAAAEAKILELKTKLMLS